MKKKYNPQLAWLRDIAALFIIILHIRRGANVNYIDDEPVNNILLETLDLGDLLFFVSSGTTLYLTIDYLQIKLN
jgi:peptidoglycan/LPS O-acetylase OafA/YrhL